MNTKYSHFTNLWHKMRISKLYFNDLFLTDWLLHILEYKITKSKLISKRRINFKFTNFGVNSGNYISWMAPLYTVIRPTGSCEFLTDWLTIFQLGRGGKVVLTTSLSPPNFVTFRRPCDYDAAANIGWGNLILFTTMPPASGMMICEKFCNELFIPTRRSF